MSEEVLVKASLSLLDYGVLGVFAVLLLATVIYLGKSAVSSKEILTEIKELLSAQVAQLEAQTKRDEVFFKTIDFERERNKQCYEYIAKKMQDVQDDQHKILNELKVCQICKK